jgi:hypothetical protein
MSDMQADNPTPTLEVRVLRDGVLVKRELCETDDEANAVVDAWSEVEGVVCQVEDLTRSDAPAGVLDPRPWEVDAEDATYEGAAYADEEDR